MHVPLAESADISDDNLQGGKVKDGDGVKGNIKYDQSPLEEGIRSVSYAMLATGQAIAHAVAYLQQLDGPYVG